MANSLDSDDQGSYCSHRPCVSEYLIGPLLYMYVSVRSCWVWGEGSEIEDCE